MLWSDINSWSSKKLPILYDKVIIESNMWIVVDITPPKLSSMIIYGKLSFLDNIIQPLNLTLQVTDISIYGSLEISGNKNNLNQTTAYNGWVNIILYGKKGSSLPVIMGEGVFLGSKVIAVAGSLYTHGQSYIHTWLKLSTTIYKNTNQIILNQYINWDIGNEIILSPTSYFNDKGLIWSDQTYTNSDEIFKIKEITHILNKTTNTNYTIIIVNKLIKHTHVCINKYNTNYCGGIGLLTRNILFSSSDSQNPDDSNYGYGGNINVFELKTSQNSEIIQTGHIQLYNTEFQNFGKINSNAYSIKLSYSNNNHKQNIIHNCSFNQNYNYILYTEHSYNVSFINNVGVRNYGGGIYIDKNSYEYSIVHNLIIGTRQLPSVLLSSFMYTRPIASITIYNSYGIIINNLVAGSEDQGYGKKDSFFNFYYSFFIFYYSFFNFYYSFFNFYYSFFIFYYSLYYMIFIIVLFYYLLCLNIILILLIIINYCFIF